MNFSQWTVWLANLDPIVGSEKAETKLVLIISNSSLNSILPVVNVIPRTSRKANRRLYPNKALLSPGATGLIVESVALCHQIRTPDERRLTRRLGIISDLYVQARVVSALRFQLTL